MRNTAGTVAACAPRVRRTPVARCAACDAASSATGPENTSSTSSSDPSAMCRCNTSTASWQIARTLASCSASQRSIRWPTPGRCTSRPTKFRLRVRLRKRHQRFAVAEADFERDRAPRVRTAVAKSIEPARGRDPVARPQLLPRSFLRRGHASGAHDETANRAMRAGRLATACRGRSSRDSSDSVAAVPQRLV